MNLVLLSVVVFIAFSSSLAKSHVALNCYIKRLKSTNQLNSSYPEYSVELNHQSCLGLMQEGEREVYDKVAVKVHEKSHLKKLRPCIMEELRVNNLVDNIFLQYVYEHSETLSEAMKKQKLDKIDVRTRRTTEDALTFCLLKEMFGEFYDSLIGQKFVKQTLDDKNIDQCTKMFAFDKNLFDADSYKFDLEAHYMPKHMVDCPTIVKAKLKELESSIETKLDADTLELTDPQKNCIMKRYRAGNFGDKLLASEVVAQFKLSKKQKAAERKKFVLVMTNMIAFLDICDR